MNEQRYTANDEAEPVPLHSLMSSSSSLHENPPPSVDLKRPGLFTMRKLFRWLTLPSLGQLAMWA